MLARDLPVTGNGYVFNAIRPEYLAIGPAIGKAHSLYAFPDDLPAGAWIDAPEYLPAGSSIAGDNCEAFLTSAWRS